MVTLSYLDLLLAALVIAALVAVIYVIFLLRSLLPSAKKLERTVDELNTVLEDVSSLTGKAKGGVEKAEGLLNKAGTSVAGAYNRLAENEMLLKGAAGLVGTLIGLVGILRILHRPRRRH